VINVADDRAKLAKKALEKDYAGQAPAEWR
jgi:hypothetical protein